MDKHIIRENAGKLWRLLSTDVHRKWNLQEVKELTGSMIWKSPVR